MAPYSGIGYQGWLYWGCLFGYRLPGMAILGLLIRVQVTRDGDTGVAYSNKVQFQSCNVYVNNLCQQYVSKLFQPLNLMTK